MPEEHVAGATTIPTIPQPAPPLASSPTTPPTPPSLDYALMAKWGSAVALATAILVLDVMKIPADHFMQFVAIPGLSALGLHTAAKTLT